MLVFITTFVLFLAEAAGNGWWARAKQFENEWFNIPGFEAWKFLNLAIFIALMIYAAKKFKVPEWFIAQREIVRAELIKAEAEKQAALSKLTAAEAKLSQVEIEKETILQKAKDEAAFEKKRLADATKLDVERLRQQTESELARLSGQTHSELRRLSAEKSIALAEQKLRSQIDGTVDANLIKGSISEIGGLN